MLVGIGEDGFIQTEFFEKDTSGRNCVRTDSAISQNIKQNSIISTAVRIFDRCTMREDAEKHIMNYIKKLAEAGYSRGLVQRCIERAEKRHEGKVKKAEQGERPRFRNAEQRQKDRDERKKASGKDFTSVCFIDYYDDTFEKDLQKIANKFRLKMPISTRGGKLLTRAYQKKMQKPISKKPPTCCPAQSQDNIWKEKMVVYMMECAHCEEGKQQQARYVGETGRFLEHRIKGHLRSIKNKDRKHSAWTDHYISHHPQKLKQPKFKVSILDQPTTHTRRKIAEAMRIAEIPENDTNINVNRHDEQCKVQSILLSGLTAQTRDKFRWNKKKNATGRV